MIYVTGDLPADCLGEVFASTARVYEVLVLGVVRIPERRECFVPDSPRRFWVLPPLQNR